MEPYELVDEIRTREDLSRFIELLVRDLVQDPEEWENPDLPRYLDALSRWTQDMDGWFKNRGEEVPQQPTWWLIGQMLYAAAIYE